MRVVVVVVGEAEVVEVDVVYDAGVRGRAGASTLGRGGVEGADQAVDAHAVRLRDAPRA